MLHVGMNHDSRRRNKGQNISEGGTTHSLPFPVYDIIFNNVTHTHTHTHNSYTPQPLSVPNHGEEFSSSNSLQVGLQFLKGMGYRQGR